MGLGDLFTDILGSKNKTNAKAPQVDANAYQYGGRPGYAESTADRYRQAAEGAQGRGAAQAGQVGVDYGQANGDRSNAMQARQGQASLAQIMQNRATGATPSIAQMQADRQMGQAQSAQASMAASARGPGALANAQRNAANNVANTQADISGQAQISGATERMQAEQAASGAYGALRGGDQAAQGQDANQAQFANQSQVAQNQFNAQQQAQQRAQNDQYSLGMTGNEMGVRNAQLTAGMNQQGQTSANSLGAQGINAGVSGQNASMNQANGMAALGLGQSAASLAFGGGAPAAKAKGGPVAGRTPYLVGEQGPELIVPKKNGFVLTADQTRQALSGVGRPQASRASLASVLGMPGREDGGPVAGGGAPTSTWGTGSGVDPNNVMSGAENEWRAGLAAGLAGAGDRERDERLPTSMMAVPGFSPGIKAGKDEPLRRMDEAASSGAHAKEAQGLDLSDREAYEAQGADYRLGRTKKLDRSGGGLPPERTLASVLSDNGKKDQQAASAIDTSYHGGGGGFAPPQLLALPARAMGGPISAGGASIGGLVPMTPHQGQGIGGGIELGASGGMSKADLDAASTGLGDPSLMRGMVGGGGITGGSSMGGQAIPGGSYGGAREDGGPVDPSKAYLTGERGPEMVVPKNTDRPETDATKQSARYQGKLASILAPFSPGLGLFYGAQSAGTHAAGAVLSAEDRAAADRLKAAQDEQAAQDAERAAMNAADRSGPAPAHSTENTVLSMTDSDVEHRIRGDQKPTLAEIMSRPPPEPKPKDRYTYDPRQAFGERFVSKTRDPISFHRGDNAPTTPQPDASYDTPLSSAEEQRFAAWKARYAPHDSGADYDLRGAFKAGLTPDKNGHWPDTFKKPNHPTFSDESQYATGTNRSKAGHWVGETFTRAKGS